jgi:hypothetical protein
MGLPMIDILGVAPFVAVTAGVTWIGQLWLYRDRRQLETADMHAKVEIHRDELTFELLKAAQQEMSIARVEVEDLRDEVRKWRAMEQHFFHFQQSLDHLEALLFADTTEARTAAERNARAFLNRMRRLSEAKGTLANEVQRQSANVSSTERNIDAAEQGLRDE